jgi:ubiquinone/menaquinone biosynthesis C-methylase UbiE
VRRLVAWLAARPSVFDGLRWFLEGGFAGHRALIARELQPLSGTVLDIGCGTGVFAAEFERERYLGIDLNPDYVAAAARKHPGYRFVAMDARRLALADASQACAFISGMLHHLGDDDASAVLQEAVRVLAPGGKLVVWEDVAPPSQWSLVCRAVQALDLGSYIRTAESYRALLARHVRIEDEVHMQSGWMHYAAFNCRAPEHTEWGPPRLPRTGPAECAIAASGAQP